MSKSKASREKQKKQRDRQHRNLVERRATLQNQRDFIDLKTKISQMFTLLNSTQAFLDNIPETHKSLIDQSDEYLALVEIMKTSSEKVEYINSLVDKMNERSNKIEFEDNLELSQEFLNMITVVETSTSTMLKVAQSLDKQTTEVVPLMNSDLLTEQDFAAEETPANVRGRGECPSVRHYDDAGVTPDTKIGILKGTDITIGTSGHSVILLSEQEKS